jgi:adenosylcobinamide-GDP ribazoletransferase
MVQTQPHADGSHPLHAATTPGSRFEEVHAFGNAIMFFTRIPMPARLRWSDSLMQRAATWYSTVGLIVGAVAAGTVWASLELFESPLAAAVVSTIATLLLTGAFHEDGLADCCDAFFGAYDRDRVLEIMKDSRIGSFGAAGLIMVLLCKIAVLSQAVSADPLENDWSRIGPLWLVPVIAHALSRAASASLLRVSGYVRANDAVGAKSKPMATRLPTTRLAICLFLGALPLILLADPIRWVVVLMTVVVSTALLTIWFHRRIGGYTGDCLGAVQQVTEVLILAALIVELTPWN